MSIFAEANSLVILEEPVDDVFIEIKKADIRGGISAENVHIVSPYSWHYPNQVQGLGDASYSQPASHASSPLLSADNYIRIKTIVQEKNGRF